jgi:hypothetical protein
MAGAERRGALALWGVDPGGKAERQAARLGGFAARVDVTDLPAIE